MADFSNTSNLAELQFSKKKKEMEEQGTQLSERDEAALFAQCVELQVLKAPATAVFPTFEEMVVNGSSGSYSVSGFVDSQNSYGATIRSNYTYNIEKVDGKWKCTDNFVDTSTSIGQEFNQINKELNQQMMSNTVLWWILGILGTIISAIIFGIQFGDLF